MQSRRSRRQRTLEVLVHLCEALYGFCFSPEQLLENVAEGEKDEARDVSISSFMKSTCQTAFCRPGLFSTFTPTLPAAAAAATAGEDRHALFKLFSVRNQHLPNRGRKCLTINQLLHFSLKLVK